MGTILEEYENKHGKRDESSNPQLWDFGLENFEDGWLAGVIWESGNTPEERMMQKDEDSHYDFWAEK